ncbi:MAG: DMSO/selenate family reductase complex B subunit [Gordonibacter sp.]|uniref:DMSO/selenate family reductase complex B subunit n=1 Tax=Gordonibacter sp. TaxID=1968902 RepID=UPI002FC8C6CF
MTQYGFYFDSTRCTGCRTCEMACKDYKDLPETAAFRKVYDYEGGTWTPSSDGTYTSDTFAYHVSLACNHCDQPKCLAACPQGAIVKDSKTGIVAIDEGKCIGSGTCVEACPYNVPMLDKESKKGLKCDGCAARTAEGTKPVCVEACPLRALDFGDIEELRAAHGNTAGIAPMPSPDETHPNIVIKECAAAKAPGDKTGAIANEKEVTGVPA